MAVSFEDHPRHHVDHPLYLTRGEELLRERLGPARGLDRWRGTADLLSECDDITGLEAARGR
jgi:hypothetical protein